MTVREKADRLLREKRVHYQGTLPDGSMVYWVDGDSGRTRIVTLDTDGQMTCDCPALIPDCAHRLAVADLHQPPDESRGSLLSPESPIEEIPTPSSDPGPLPEEARLNPTEFNTTLDPAPAGEDDPEDDEDVEVEVVGDAGPVPVVSNEQRRDLIDLATAPITYRTLEAISRTDFVPAALRNKPAACLAAILTGRELGIGPMTSLRQIAVIDGSPTLSAELMLKLYRQAGHQLEVLEANEHQVHLKGIRGDTGETLEVTYNLDDADRAGLITITEDGEVRARSRKGYPLPWESYTGDLLWARAVTRLVRRLAPDLRGAA